MAHADLAKTIDDAFEARAAISFGTAGAVREAVETRSTCSTAARRASPRSRPTAAGRSTSG